MIPSSSLRLSIDYVTKGGFFSESVMCFSNLQIFKNGIFLPKLFWPTVRKKCSCDREKLLKFEAEGREFAKQFIQTVKIQSNGIL